MQYNNLRVSAVSFIHSARGTPAAFAAAFSRCLDAVTLPPSPGKPALPLPHPKGDIPCSGGNVLVSRQRENAT